MDAPFYQRTWIDIDLDALKANYRTAKSLTKATVTCVIKSNAYGHGAVRVAQALAEEGCPCRVHRMGMPDVYSCIVGTQQYLRQHYGMDDEAVAAKAEEILKEERA